MGTELQCKNYSPECFSTGNLGKDTNSLWSIYYEETDTNVNFRSVYSPRHTNRYGGYDREGLKQTMLQHEAVFRAQVYELHRLHRIQRELMDGLQRKAWGSQQCAVPSCIVLNDRLNLSPSAAYKCDSKFQLKVLQNKCIQCGPTHAENTSVSGKGPGKDSKMVIDLQLSADAYIEENMGNSKEKAIPAGIFAEVAPSIFDAKPENHMGFVSSNEHSCGERCKMDFKLHNGPESRSLDHLSKVACYDEPSDLSPSRFWNGKSQNFASSSEFCDFPRNVLPAKLHAAKHLSALSFNSAIGKEQEQTFLKDKYGYCEAEVKAIFGKKIPGLSKPKQFNFLRSVDFLPTPSLFYPKEPYSVEEINGNKRNHLSSTCYADHPVSCSSGHLSFQGRHSSSEPGKLEVQGRSLISAQGACNPGKEWKFDCLRPGSVEGKVSIPCPGVNAPPDASSNPIPSGNTIFYNVENFDNAKSNTQEAQKCIKAWNEVYKTSENEINSAQMLSRFSQGKPVNGALESKMLSSSQWSRLRQDVFCRENAKLEVTHQDMKDEGSGISGGQKISEISGGSKAYIACTPIDNAKNSFYPHNSTGKITSVDLEGRNLDKHTPAKGLKCSGLGPMRATDLNLNVTCLEQRLLDTSQPSLQNDAKTSREIDLELPAEGLVEDRCIVDVPTVDCEQEKEPSTDATILSAAEVIISISSHRSGHSETSVHHLSKDCASSQDALQWLAGLVCSNECDISSDGSDGGNKGSESFSTDCDDMDYFEAMTLKLRDTRFDDHLYKPPDHIREKCLAPVLLPKMKSCQTRKRKQRMDFQKDVLPSIASLSRHEVSEDLQMIGGMMRSSGHPWQASVARTTTRSRGRNCSRKLPRGKSIAILAEEAPLDRDWHQGKGRREETAVLASSLMGWGRRTRRCHRPRHPSGSIASLFNINAE